MSGNINNDDNNQALFSGVEDYKNVFLNLIDENVDFYSQNMISIAMTLESLSPH